MLVLNDGGGRTDALRLKSFRVLRDVGSIRRGRPRTDALRQKSSRVLRDVGPDRRGRPRTDALRLKSGRVLRDVGSIRRGSELSLDPDCSNIADFVVCLNLHHTCSNTNIVGQTGKPRSVLPLIEFAKSNSASDTRDTDRRSTRSNLRLKVRPAVS